MIQFNLLPDVKVEYIKARRSKRMVLLVSAGVATLSLVVFISLFMVVNIFQAKHIKDLNKDIKTDTSTLHNVPNLDKILTVQNQLTSLTSLHDAKPASSLLTGYLGQLTPAKATISSVKMDFSKNSLDLGGNADSLSTVNTYVDTLKFITYTVVGSKEVKKVFSGVVLTSYSSTDKGASYQITANFDPAIFNGTKPVTLVVPKITTTRSETEKPTDLFNQPAVKTGL